MNLELHPEFQSSSGKCVCKSVDGREGRWLVQVTAGPQSQVNGTPPSRNADDWRLLGGVQRELSVTASVRPGVCLFTPGLMLEVGTRPGLGLQGCGGTVL